MAFCINCGQELAEGAKFCANCGKAVNGENPTTQRKTVYEGQVHKCPNCGEVLNSYETNCPTCGYEIRDSRGVSSVRELAMKLEQLESTRTKKSGSNILTQAFGFDSQLQTVDERKIDLIRNFAIPNTKEDVIEFIVLAAGNIDMKVYGINSNRYLTFDPARRELSDAWLAKLEQADRKAEILFGQTQEYLSVRNTFEKKMKEVKQKKRQLLWLILGMLGAVAIILALTLGLAFYTGDL